MKKAVIFSFCAWLTRFGAGWLGVGLATTSFASGLPSDPSVLSVRNTRQSVVVSVEVPRGWQGIVLESSTNASTGPWVPRAASHSGKAGRLTFRLPATLKGQQFRVQGQLKSPVPKHFYDGRRKYGRQRSLTWRPDQGQGEAFMLEADGNLPATVSVPSEATSSRTVTDSDIWEMSGDTLYLFNQLRGLQIISLSNPAAPVLEGQFGLPAAGEQMFLLDPVHVALLASDNCSSDGNSELLIIDVSGPSPQQIAELPVTGWVDESRLVGTALYVAADGYLPASGTNSAFEDWGTIVQSFDLSVPAAPVARSTRFFPGADNAVLATDNWFLVAMQDFAETNSQPEIQIIDISAADGVLGAMISVTTAWQVFDSTDMNVNGNVLTVVSEAYEDSTNDLTDGNWLTTVQTFSLAKPGVASPLGTLNLATGDELFGVSFDTNRVYISTYQETDPLWVVDLSNPAKPVVAGSVQVPGYSTVIHPMGDRLLTVGAESNLVAVSIFDVSNPAQPGLLNTVLLGESYSWSEVSQDDKALTVLPGLGLVLVPYEGETTNGWASQVQLIDLGADTLTPRGVLDHLFQPRRATNYDGQILSVSDEALVSVNISNRDEPTVSADVELAWPVDEIFLQGNYLLEVATSAGWIGEAPAVRVASVGQPDTMTNELDLEDLPIVGTTLRNGRLYLLQSPAFDYGPIYAGPMMLTQPGGLVPALEPDPSTNLILTVVDVSELPTMNVLEQTTLPVNAFSAGGSYQALWPATNILVWFTTGFNLWMNPLIDAPVSAPIATMGAAPGVVSSSGLTNFAATGALLKSARSNYRLAQSQSPNVPPSLKHRKARRRNGPQAQRMIAPISAPSRPPSHVTAAGAQPFLSIPYWWPWWSDGGVRLLAFDVSYPTNVQMVSSLDIDPTNSWGFGNPVCEQGLVYFTYEVSTNLPNGDWGASAWLDVADFSTPTNPVVRPPVNVPGQLAGVASNGAVLYFLANSAPAEGNADGNLREMVEACAYDGVSAYQVASLPLPATWPCPVVVTNDTVYFGNASSSTNADSTLEAWNLSPQGKFQLAASAKVTQPISALAVFGGLLAAEDVNSGITLFEAGIGGNLVPCGEGSSPNCLWFDLNRAASGPGAGLWVPLDDYGVASVPLSGASGR